MTSCTSIIYPVLVLVHSLHGEQLVMVRLFGSCVIEGGTMVVSANEMKKCHLIIPRPGSFQSI